MLPMSICTKKGPLPYEAVPCYPDSEYAARYTTPLAKAYFDMEIASIFDYDASIREIPIVISSNTSKRTRTVSREVKIVILFSAAQRRMITPSS